MMLEKSRRVLLVGLCVLGLVGASASLAQEHERAMAGHFEHDGRGQVLDNRFNHGHYYPARGSVVHELPAGYRPYTFHGSRYYFYGGIWYAPGPGGFIVARPPIGLFLTVLPPFYTTVWFGGVPFYYANDVYYQWYPDQGGYAVVDPPAGAEQPNATPQAAPAAPAADNFYIYPRNGQTQEQQAADRYECHNWAKGQTGFDPSQAGAGGQGADNGANGEHYQRAMTACLEARGYSVR
jgi:hypothetical protein